MMQIICAPENLIPQTLKSNVIYFSAYSNPKRERVGYFGTAFVNRIRKAGIQPSQETWDFNTIALSVAAADKSVSRRLSPDGWTRAIALSIYLCNPNKWNRVKSKLEKLLRFLTGDFWNLTFRRGGTMPSFQNSLLTYDYDCISLLSGGVDSLVGAIDLVADGYKPNFVSQIFRGDARAQSNYATKIRPNSSHFQWNHNIHCPKGKSEGTTRGRSITFFSFAAIAACLPRTNHSSYCNIYVPENGFISLNLPLNMGRMGSFSTKTTHPIYLKKLQEVWDKVGINCKLIMLYQLKTKGELLKSCKNQQLLETLIFSSVSCGKYRVYKMKHCGRCVPCLVRRAAILKWGKPDMTKDGYWFENLERVTHGNSDDVGAVANACVYIEQMGSQLLTAGNLSFASRDDRGKFEDVFLRGIEELRVFLHQKNIV